MSPDFENLAGLGGVGMLLALVFRTLWKQEGGWRAVLTASRDDASTARADAQVARQDAAAARQDAAAMRTAEAECRQRLTALDTKVARLILDNSLNTQRLDNLAGGE